MHFHTFRRSAAALCAPLTLIAQTPEAYFADAHGLSGDALKSTLQQIIANHTVLSYTPGVWNAHKDIYEDPQNPNNLILFYSGDSFPKSAQDRGSGSAEFWNREHLWPNSYGIDDSSSRGYTDLFHLVPANKAVNLDRSNKFFDIAEGSAIEDPATPLAPGNREDDDSWEPADAFKGWAARAMLYMDTRYTQLSLVDTPPEPTSSGAIMAQRQTMLEWNRQFPPQGLELHLQEKVFSTYQHNRNPFIDFPEFADAIHVGHPSWGSWRLHHFSLAELRDPATAAAEADPDNDGLPNLFELAVYADPRSSTPSPNPLALTAAADGLTLAFIRAANHADLNLSWQLQSSSDAVTWANLSLANATTTPILTTANATPSTPLERVSLSLPIPPSQTFYRLVLQSQ